MSISLLTLGLMGTLAFLASLVCGQFGLLGVKQHFVLSLGATLLLVMAHSFVMFFLIATGVEMKDIEREAGLGDSFRRRTIALKSRVFPVATLALLLVIANFILGGAAHTRAMPMWAHSLIAWGTFAVCALALWRESLALGENNRLIEEIGARRRGAARG